MRFCPGLSPPILSFFHNFVLVVPVVVDAVFVFVVDVIVVFVTVVVTHMWSPVALAQKGIVLQLCENPTPVCCGVLVQEKKLKEFGIAEQMPEVTIKCPPLAFGDEQVPCDKEGDDKGGKEEVFDPDDPLEVGSNSAAGQDVDDDNQRAENHEEHFGHSNNGPW